MRQLSLLLLGAGLVGCSAQDQDNTNTTENLGDHHLARHVTGIYMLSTDYQYQEPCNYLPDEYVRSLFQLGEQVEMEKNSDPQHCEFHWGANKIGIQLESEKPFESVYQSEYYFNKLFEPKANDKLAQNTGTKPTLFGPDPTGTGSEGEVQPTPSGVGSGSEARTEPSDGNGDTAGGTSTANSASGNGASKQDSTRGSNPSIPFENVTDKNMPLLTAQAKNTPTGQAVSGVGDKAIWEPGKKTLHVLFNNHVFTIVAEMPGNAATVKQGAIGLARRFIYTLNGDRDPRD